MPPALSLPDNAATAGPLAVPLTETYPLPPSDHKYYYGSMPSWWADSLPAKQRTSAWAAFSDSICAANETPISATAHAQAAAAADAAVSKLKAITERQKEAKRRKSEARR